MLVNHIDVNGRMYNVGDKLRYVSSGKIDGYRGLEYIAIGDVVTIRIIKTTDRGGKGKILLGVQASKRIAEWHDLDGELPRSNGYWIEKGHLARNFELVTSAMVVGSSFSFRKKDLKDMQCKILSPMPGNKESVVEFEKDIGGCGGDGLGKAGHCLVVPNAVLSTVKKEKKNVKKVAKKSK